MYTLVSPIINIYLYTSAHYPMPTSWISMHNMHGGSLTVNLIKKRARERDPHIINTLVFPRVPEYWFHWHVSRTHISTRVHWRAHSASHVFQFIACPRTVYTTQRYTITNTTIIIIIFIFTSTTIKSYLFTLGIACKIQIRFSAWLFY